ncbi:MAG: phytanoyl-CoA dioxygenase family protein [Halioglobus sp.]
MSIDMRIRSEADICPISPGDFFSGQLQAYADGGQEYIQAWLESNSPEDFTVECGGGTWQLSVREGGLSVADGVAHSGLHVRMSEEEFSGLINDEYTPITFFTTGDLDIPRGTLEDYLDWWLILRAVVDKRPIHVPGAIALLAKDGSELNLARKFSIEDPLEEMRYFLETAGFLHIRAVFSTEEMAAISRDMDSSQGEYSEGDGKSWWATTSQGDRRLVRMQAFDQVSDATARLLQDPRFTRIGEIPGLGHVHNSLEGNQIEALIKPLNVVQGISDLPWHKDCAQGRHSLECCSLTAGISVTGADKESGQICVIAGSHRALIRPSFVRDPMSFGLPVVEVPTSTGDITIHLSCTHHMAQAPKTRERRVMYAGFRFPTVDVNSSNVARARLNTAREAAQHMSDKKR